MTERTDDAKEKSLIVLPVFEDNDVGATAGVLGLLVLERGDQALLYARRDMYRQVLAWHEAQRGMTREMRPYALSFHDVHLRLIFRYFWKVELTRFLGLARYTELMENDRAPAVTPFYDDELPELEPFRLDRMVMHVNQEAAFWTFRGDGDKLDADKTYITSVVMFDAMAALL